MRSYVRMITDHCSYDVTKRTKRCKRHIAVDTDGRLLMVNLSTADVQDAVGAEKIVAAARIRWPWLKHGIATICSQATHAT